jgi:hypothetical protein
MDRHSINLRGTGIRFLSLKPRLLSCIKDHDYRTGAMERMLAIQARWRQGQSVGREEAPCGCWSSFC